MPHSKLQRLETVRSTAMMLEVVLVVFHTNNKLGYTVQI